MTSKGRITTAVALFIVLAFTLPVGGASEFVFFGYSKYLEGHPIDVVGSEMDIYGVLTPAGGLDLPLALDTDNYQYTLHVTRMMLAATNNTPKILGK